MSYIKLGSITSYCDLVVDGSILSPEQLNKVLTESIITYDNLITYNTNDLCYYDGHIYKSLIDNNINVLPINSDNWKRITIDITEYEELLDKISNKKSDIDPVRGTYVADYLEFNYHRLILSGDTTILVSNIPDGEFLMMFIDNSLGYSLIFGNEELLSSDDTYTYQLVFTNSNGKIMRVGNPIQNYDDSL